LACALVGTGYFHADRLDPFGAYTNADRGSLARWREVSAIGGLPSLRSVETPRRQPHGEP